MQYNELAEAALRLNEGILDKHFGDAEFNRELRNEVPENIDGINVEDPILVFGINPASSDLRKYGQKKECIIKHVPVELESQFIDQLKKDGYVYPTYFKKNFELFKEAGYGMLWQCDGYLDRHCNRLGHEMYAELKKHADKEKIVIFTDLFFVKETNAKKVIPVLSEYESEIFELFDKQIDYYKPKLIVITNAQASTYAMKMINRKNGLKTDEMMSDTTYRGVNIIYSSMVTGQRALDNFNYLRLKKDIERYIR